MNDAISTAPEGAAAKEARAGARRQAEKRLGTTLGGRFRIESLIDIGGMGAVYLAIQEPLERKVALKCIRSVLTDDELAVKRFIQEARAISQLQHPNIVTLYDFGQDDDGTLFIAMELLAGESLRDRVEREGPLPAAVTLDVVTQIARALAQAHAAGIIHRDLKPDNVMLSELVGHGLSVKVVDFGVAKLAQQTGEEALTGTGHVVGTPGYIAPEQINGVVDDPRSDLYALGVLWFEALCGASPFDGETPMKKAFQHLTEEAPRPSDRRPGLEVPAAIEDLVLRLLQKDPSTRPPTAEALLSLLERLHGDGGLTVSGSALSPAQPTLDATLPPVLSPAPAVADAEDADKASFVAATPETSVLPLASAGKGEELEREVAQESGAGASFLMSLMIMVAVAAALGFGLVFFLAGG